MHCFQAGRATEKRMSISCACVYNCVCTVRKSKRLELQSMWWGSAIRYITSPPESEQGERMKKNRNMREKYGCGRKYENIEMRAAFRAKLIAKTIRGAYSKKMLS